MILRLGKCHVKYILGSMNYMAPEVCEDGYCETSDVFALGCVLFELVTTWLYDGQEAVDKMREIRQDPIVLDEIFEEISRVNKLLIGLQAIFIVTALES